MLMVPSPVILVTKEQNLRKANVQVHICTFVMIVALWQDVGPFLSSMYRFLSMEIIASFKATLVSSELTINL